jgi:hypothetical protein
VGELLQAGPNLSERRRSVWYQHGLLLNLFWTRVLMHSDVHSETGSSSCGTTVVAIIVELMRDNVKID